RHAGVPLEKIGRFHPKTVQRILSLRPLATAMAWAFYPTLRKSYCSMLNDLPAGRTEIDNYNGRLIELADGRNCELNRRVVELVKRMEREGQRPGLDKLEPLS